jgi:hypothetical protein
MTAACKDVWKTPPSARLIASIKFSLETEPVMLSVKGDGNDSLLFNMENVQEFGLPLRANFPDTRYILAFDTVSVPDIMIIEHQDSLIYESLESGFYYTFNITKISYSTNRIDSVAMVSTTVTEDWHENIILYLNNLPDDDADAE